MDFNHATGQTTDFTSRKPDGKLQEKERRERAVSKSRWDIAFERKSRISTLNQLLYTDSEVVSSNGLNVRLYTLSLDC